MIGRNIASFSERQARQEVAPLVLVIDQSPTVRKIIEVALARLGYPVQSFADGPTALRWLTRPGTPTPALIYLDLEVPRMDGYAMARALRSLPGLKQTPLILLLARGGTLDHLKGRLLGAQMSLRKPFRVEELLALTRAALSGEPDELAPLLAARRAL